MSYPKEAQTKLAIHELIKRRWSPRAFADRPVEEEKLQRIFEAARWAPSSRNEQPWHFIVARQADAHYPKLFEALNEWNQKWTFTAPVVGATIVARKFSHNDSLNPMRWHDLGLAMGNLSLQATAEGLYLHQMAGFDAEVILQNYHLEAADYEAVTMFVLGYQDFGRLAELEERYHDSEKARRHRKPLSELISGASFGESPRWVNEP